MHLPGTPHSSRHLLSLFASTLLLTLVACANPEPDPVTSIDGGSDPVIDAGTDTDGGTESDGGLDTDGGSDTDGGQGSFTATFELQFGTAQDDVLNGVVAAEDGTVFGFGFAGGSQDKENDGPIGAADAVVVKRAPGAAGVQQFRLSSAGNATDSFESALIEDGTLTLVGRTRGAFPPAVNAGKFDTFVAKMGGEGTFASGVMQFGDERSQHPRNLLRTSNGGLAVSGYNEIYVPTNYVEAYEDPTLAFLTGSGTAESPWAIGRDLRFDTPITDFALGAVAAKDDSGDVFVARYHSGGTKRGAWVIRYSPSGDVVWERILSGGLYDSANALAIAPTGELVVAGSGFRKFVKSYGGQDVFVLWLDPVTGDLLRSAQAGGTEADWTHAIAVDARGHVFVAGYTLGDVAASNSGEADLMLLEFDASGAWVRGWQDGTAGWDELAGIALLPSGELVVTGSTTSEFVAGQRVGGWDALMLQLAPR